MTLYKDPNHKDCWIECTGSGSGAAVYADPPGRCFKHCGEDGLARSLEEPLIHLATGTTFYVSTSVPYVGIGDILSLPFGQLDQQDQYQPVLDRLQRIVAPQSGAPQEADFEFAGEISLQGLLTTIADHFEGEQTVEA